MSAAAVECATDTAGARVDKNISSMTGEIAVPRSNGELVFDAPWQSRAFGMAVSMCQAGYFPWDKFRAELAKAIKEQGQNGVDEYYHRWLDALEACLEPAKLFEHDALHEREHEYRDHVRDEVF
ncbi:nitrile hydratase accessory protein [Agrobacterium sp. NPDC090273]|uniref:nitrile hydratase accessory protein n=1 Tax=Agrobacterium sp. NPDC090273 TaxID=3363919 RepID=UPI00383A12B0